MKKFKYNIFIPGNVPSLKNSKVATGGKAMVDNFGNTTGWKRGGVFMSKTCSKYLQGLGVKKYSCSKGTFENYKTRPNLFEKAVGPMKDEFSGRGALIGEGPHIIGLFFIRNSKRKFDFINAAQIICDLLTAHGVIEDDNMDCLIPMPINVAGSWYTIDKENPGCIVYF